MRVRLTAVTLAVSGALVAAQAVSAQDPPPPPTPDDSAVSQYVEAVPSASGPKAPGVGRAERRPLPPKVEAHVKAAGDADSKALELLATSATLGAPKHASLAPKHASRITPARSAPHPNGVRVRDEHVVSDSTGRVSTRRRLSAAATAVQDGGGTQLALLGLTVLGITVAVGWAAAQRARRRPV
jgi:hypothetical protein